ncbi:MAG TPA: hypothetical protein VD833_07985, partial [Vicinamibacterales bacterium]|nr:hypothetical protein [Vicinamibacterales bacterium]
NRTDPSGLDSWDSFVHDVSNAIAGFGDAMSLTLTSMRQKTQAAPASAFSMRMNRWRVATLFASRTWVMPPGRTRMAARWKTSKRHVWTFWSRWSTVCLRVRVRSCAPVSI